MPTDTPALTRDEGLAVIAAWLRNLSAEERSALSRLLANDATNPDANPTRTGVGKALAPVMMRMDLGDDPLSLLSENLPGYGGGTTEAVLLRAFDALRGKAMAMRDAAETLREMAPNALPVVAELLHDLADDGGLSVIDRQRCDRVALMADAIVRGDDPLADESLLQ